MNTTDLVLFSDAPGAPSDHHQIPPSADELLDTRSSICNLVAANGQLILSGFVMSIADVNERRDWYQRQIDSGATQTCLGVKYFYHDFSDQGIIPPGKDWINDLDGWVRLFWEAFDVFPKGLQIALTQGDGDWDDPNSESRQFCNPSSPTYGPRLVEGIRSAAERQGYPDPVPFAEWFYGWEPDPRSCETCVPILRQAVGPDAKIALHLQQGYGNPTGDGGAFWAGVGQLIDSFYYQALAFEPGRVDRYGQEYWIDNAIEILDRMSPVGTPMPGAEGHKYYDKGTDSMKIHPPYTIGPDWFAGLSKRARRVFYECINFWFSRNRLDPQAAGYAKHVARVAQSLGFQHFGTGLP